MIETNKIGNVANTFEINTEDIAHVQSTGMKNLIINGDFSIWQRGGSFTQTGYTADRWYASDKPAISKGVYSSEYGQPLWASKGGDNKSWQWIGQFVELPEYYKGKTLTISFKIKWNTFSPEAYLFMRWVDGSLIALGNNSMGENIGGWQTVSHTFVVPDDATDYSSFTIRFHGNAETGTMNYGFDLAQVQLEEGSVATPFEQRPIGLELSLCQRYYYIIKSKSAGDLFLVGVCNGIDYGEYYFSVTFPTPLRIPPSASSLSHNITKLHKPGVAYSDIITLSLSTPGVSGVKMVSDGNSDVSAIAFLRNSSSAPFIAIDAEIY